MRAMARSPPQPGLLWRQQMILALAAPGAETARMMVLVEVQCHLDVTAAHPRRLHSHQLVLTYKYRCGQCAVFDCQFGCQVSVLTGVLQCKAEAWAYLLLHRIFGLVSAESWKASQDGTDPYSREWGSNNWGRSPTASKAPRLSVCSTTCNCVTSPYHTAIHLPVAAVSVALVLFSVCLESYCRYLFATLPYACHYRQSIPGNALILLHVIAYCVVSQGLKALASR